VVSKFPFNQTKVLHSAVTSRRQHNGQSSDAASDVEGYGGTSGKESAVGAYTSQVGDRTVLTGMTITGPAKVCVKC